MILLDQSYELLDELNGKEIIKKIELCGRVCYKSEDKITDDSAERFVRNIISRGHESVLEHVSFSVRFITDRAVTHELVRHRLASYSQESQRYVNYGKAGVTFIRPIGMKNDEAIRQWVASMSEAESAYYEILNSGCPPQIARTVLPNSTKTEIIVSANIREWRHILKLRIGKAAHPQIRSLMNGLLKELKQIMPAVFDDIKENEE